MGIPAVVGSGRRGAPEGLPPRGRALVRQAATGADLRRMAVTATPDRIPRAIAAVGGEYRPGQSECGIEGVSAGAGQGAEVLAQVRRPVPTPPVHRIPLERRVTGGRDGRPAEGEFGTYFIGYARSPSRTIRMLQNMFIGLPPGNYDRILDVSTAVTGTLFFAPTVDMLDETGTLPKAAADPADPQSDMPDPATSLGIGSLKGN